MKYFFRTILLPAALFAGFTPIKAQFYVESGAETYITGGDQSLTLPYETDRSAAPGYFSGAGTASYIDATDALNINGYQKHYADAANQAYTFVVGSGTDLRTLAISGTIPATSVVATAWIVGDPTSTPDPSNSNTFHPINSMASGLAAVSPSGQWDWLDVSGDNAGSTVTVSIPDMSGFGLAANLRLVGWDGSKWVDLSGGTTANTNAENSTLSGTIQAGIQALAVGTTSTALPVIFGDISAFIQNGLLKISWMTNKEVNSDRFLVQISNDGEHFVNLAEVASLSKDGNSSEILKYEFSKELNEVVAMMGVSLAVIISSLLLLSGFAVTKMDKRRKIAIGMALFMALMAGLGACSKNNREVLKPGDTPVYVKILQVDKDGVQAASKVVKAVNQ